MNSKKDIKALLSWHQHDASNVAGCYYKSHCENPGSSSSSAHDDEIDLMKLASEPPDHADFSIQNSFTGCDGDWIRDKVRNLRFEKQKIHVRKKLVVVPEPPSEEELLTDLKGYNGQWRRQKAEEAWSEHVERVENKRKQQVEREDRQKQSRLKKEERLRENIAKARHSRLLKEDRERRAEEQRAKREAEEEEKRQKKQAYEEEQQRRQNDRKPCGACKASGICVACDGKGFFVSMYLSSSVTAKSSDFRGRTARGCENCGGRSEYTQTGKLRKGNGKCSICSGTGKVASSNLLDQLRDKSGSIFSAASSLSPRLGGMSGLKARFSTNLSQDASPTCS